MESFQEQVLKYISDYYEIKGHAPSVDAIVIELGAGSIIEVTDCLAELEKLGYIRQNQFGISLLKNSAQAKIIVDIDRKLRVFLCHASQDKHIVRKLYQRLLAEGWIDPWLDEEKLLPGQDWDMEIEKIVETTDVVIVCLSNHSITKEGYIQKELRFVLDIADEKLENTIFVMPIRLDNCLIPRRLRKWQYVDYFLEQDISWSYKKIINALIMRENQIRLAENNQIHLPEVIYGKINLSDDREKIIRKELFEEDKNLSSKNQSATDRIGLIALNRKAYQVYAWIASFVLGLSFIWGFYGVAYYIIPYSDLFLLLVSFICGGLIGSLLILMQQRNINVGKVLTLTIPYAIGVNLFYYVIHPVILGNFSFFDELLFELGETFFQWNVLTVLPFSLSGYFLWYIYNKKRNL